MMQQTPVLARLICEDDPMDGRQADREGRDATDKDRAPPPSETPPAQAAQESPKVESNPNEAGKFSNLHKKAYCLFPSRNDILSFLRAEFWEV